jgi:hypothetical protein
MKRRNKIAAALFFAVSIPAVSTWTQNSLRSAYFLEGYTYRHQMNPAFASERNYVGMPVLGNFNRPTVQHRCVQLSVQTA